MNKKFFNLGMAVVAVLTSVLASTSCSNTKSYAELLRDERYATNAFLAEQRVVNSIPEDTVFEVGPNAPYYRIDDDENATVYMQVLKLGNRFDEPANDEAIYFRYMRFSIIDWVEYDGDVAISGNAEDMGAAATYFLYNNYTLETSAQWGVGLQLPIKLVGVDSEVNLVIKSQAGLLDELAYVQPFHYNVRYFRSAI